MYFLGCDCVYRDQYKHLTNLKVRATEMVKLYCRRVSLFVEARVSDVVDIFICSSLGACFSGFTCHSGIVIHVVASKRKIISISQNRHAEALYKCCFSNSSELCICKYI